MPLRLHFLENVLDSPVRPNNERRPRHAHHLLAIHVLFLDHAISVADLLVGVAEQGKRQAVLFLKFLERLGRVR